MSALIHQRCFSHSLREAAARCPTCGRCYCRECVTEHDDKVICASCLRKLVKPRLTQRSWFIGLLAAGGGLSGLFVAWVFYYLLGEALLAVPSAFHEGTMWRDRILNLG